ncbi:MAG: hypothetical protein R3B45_09645 [Bdellovibrionota bacterium]
MKFFSEITISFFILLLFSCSAEVDEENPGICDIRCDGASLGSASDMRFRILSPIEDIACIGNLAAGSIAEISTPVTIRMIAERPRKLIYNSPFGDNASSDYSAWQSVGGISFQPVISGIMSPNRYNDENVTVAEDGAITPAEYVGITTPKSEWCTDTCGVATIQIWPACAGGGASIPVSIQLQSGSLSSDAMSFTVTHQE